MRPPKINALLTAVFVLLISMSVSQLALANHSSVRIENVVKIDNQSCAIELQIGADETNDFQDSDAVTLNGITLVTMADLILDGINLDGAEHNAGDHILISSDTFADTDGLELYPDMLFPDADCLDFDNLASFAFVIDDGTNMRDRIDVEQFLRFGNDTTAVGRNQTGNFAFYDLNFQTVVLTDNGGSSVVYGTELLISEESQLNGTSSSCSLYDGSAPLSNSTAMGIITSLGIGAVLFLKKLTTRE